MNKLLLLASLLIALTANAYPTLGKPPAWPGPAMVSILTQLQFSGSSGVPSVIRWKGDRLIRAFSSGSGFRKTPR
ncbi:MAG: hypothetical protein IPH31_24700 [Lewinellaceae bacterium]|nr:hypothetical protein [Lewinellaceae bacterium]